MRKQHSFSRSKGSSNLFGGAFDALNAFTPQVPEHSLNEAYDNEIKRLQESRARLGGWRKQKDFEFRERQKRRAPSDY